MSTFDIAALTALHLGHPRARVTVEPLPYAWGSPATAGLWTVSAQDPGCMHGEQELFVKLLRDVRLWPGLSGLPTEEHRQEFVGMFPWRYELDTYLAGLPDLMPDGMRMPLLHHWAEPDDQHVLMWFERIHERPGAWSLDEYARAAYLLGRLAGRRREGAEVNSRLPAVAHVGANTALRFFVEHRVLIAAVGALRSDDLWEHPVVAECIARLGDTDLRRDMLALAARAPRLLDLLDDLPLTFAHGDASPQNLLVDERDPNTFVVIDFGFGTLLPVGFDLGQLLVGLAHAGLVDPDELPDIDAVLVAPYVAGLRDESFDAPEISVRHGYYVGLALRTALVSLPFEELAGPRDEELVRLVDERVRLTRRLLDLTEAYTAVSAS